VNCPRWKVELADVEAQQLPDWDYVHPVASGSAGEALQPVPSDKPAERAIGVVHNWGDERGGGRRGIRQGV